MKNICRISNKLEWRKGANAFGWEKLLFVVAAEGSGRSEDRFLSEKIVAGWAQKKAKLCASPF